MNSIWLYALFWFISWFWEALSAYRKRTLNSWQARLVCRSLSKIISFQGQNQKEILLLMFLLKLQHKENAARQGCGTRHRGWNATLAVQPRHDRGAVLALKLVGLVCWNWATKPFLIQTIKSSGLFFPYFYPKGEILFGFPFFPLWSIGQCSGVLQMSELLFGAFFFLIKVLY